MTLSRRSLLLGTGGVVLGGGALAACSSGGGSTTGAAATGGASASTSAGTSGTLSISAIPDQDPELLNRLYPMVADALSSATGFEVQYTPITDYTAVVRAFQAGDIQLSWMGGLTGVQARTLVPGSNAIAQRDIDQDFHSVFIATKDSGIAPFTDVSGLKALAGHTFTFGSETSTSGRLMPEYFMMQGGFDIADLKGEPGFSGSHDATIEAVATGSFEAGALNEQVWKSTQDAGQVDLSNVVEVYRTPGFHDYHWLVRPDLDQTLGAGATDKITAALLGLSASNPDDKKILDLFGAREFVPAQNSDYDQIAEVAKKLGLLTV